MSRFRLSSMLIVVALVSVVVAWRNMLAAVILEHHRLSIIFGLLYSLFFSFSANQSRRRRWIDAIFAVVSLGAFSAFLCLDLRWRAIPGDALFPRDFPYPDNALLGIFELSGRISHEGSVNFEGHFDEVLLVLLLLQLATATISGYFFGRLLGRKRCRTDSRTFC